MITWLVLALLWLAISFLALQPQPQAAPSSGWDKFDHLAAFAALGFVACWARRGRGPAAVLIVLCVYGGVIEWLQMSIPGRSAEWGDWAADLLGASLGAAIFWLAQRWRQRRREG